MIGALVVRWRSIFAVALVVTTMPVRSEERIAVPSAETLTDAAIVALIIAGSIAAYKALGKPCACPSDLMRNGQPCGHNSAYVKPSGYKPLCSPSDITPAMIAAFRASRAIPPIKP